MCGFPTGHHRASVRRMWSSTDRVAGRVTRAITCHTEAALCTAGLMRQMRCMNIRIAALWCEYNANLFQN